MAHPWYLGLTRGFQISTPTHVKVGTNHRKARNSPWMAIWSFPPMGVPQNESLIMKNPIKMDDVGVPPF